MIDLRLGKCLDVMVTMPDASIDLILTSPPYDNLRKYASGSAFDFEGVADQCKRLLKPGGVLVWVVGDQTKNGSETGTSFRQALHFMSIGLNLHDTMIYEKKNFVPLTHRRYEQVFEYMFVFANRRPKTFNAIKDPCVRAGKKNLGTTHYRDGEKLSSISGIGKLVHESKIRRNCWRYSTGGKKTGHPAVFPLQLAIDHILSWTNAGDTVLDCFMGSGTTGEACIKTDRKFIGIEKAPEYLTIAQHRIAQASEQPCLALA